MVDDFQNLYFVIEFGSLSPIIQNHKEHFEILPIYNTKLQIEPTPKITKWLIGHKGKHKQNTKFDNKAMIQPLQ